MRQSGLTKSKDPHPYNTNMSTLSWGKVVARNSDNTVDVALQYGSTFQHVQVCSNVLGSQVGSVYLPTHSLTNPIQTSSGVWDTPIVSTKGDLFCVVGFLDGSSRQPKVLGFFPPNQTEMSFSSLGIKVDRHESSTYHITLPSGVDEQKWADGSYLVAGSTSSYDMSQENPAWNAPTQSTPFNFVFHHPSGLSIEVDPTGKLTINPVNGVAIGGTSAVALSGTLGTWLVGHTHTSAASGSPTSTPNQSLPNISATNLTTS